MLKKLQKEAAEWTQNNFGVHPAWHPLLGIQEEVGELSHAHLKSEQGIRGSSDEHRSEKIDAIGDIVIYLADYCTQESINLEQAVLTTWYKVKQRDWNKDKEHGGDVVL